MPTEYITRRTTISHAGKRRIVKDKIPMGAALAELAGDTECHMSRLRCGATIKRQRMVGRCRPFYVRFEYFADVRPRGMTHRLRVEIDHGLRNGPTL